MNLSLLPVRLALGATSYTVGWVVATIATVACVGLYWLSQRVYAANAFNYSSQSVLKQLFSRLLRKQIS